MNEITEFPKYSLAILNGSHEQQLPDIFLALQLRSHERKKVLTSEKAFGGKSTMNYELRANTYLFLSTLTVTIITIASVIIGLTHQFL